MTEFRAFVTRIRGLKSHTRSPCALNGPVADPAANPGASTFPRIGMGRDSGDSPRRPLLALFCRGANVGPLGPQNPFAQVIVGRKAQGPYGENSPASPDLLPTSSLTGNASR